MGNEKLRVLIVDDDEDDYIIIHEMLKDIRGQEYQVEWLPSDQDFERLLENKEWDVILIDYDLGGRDGLALIRLAVNKGISAPLIMITGRGRYELDVEAMRSGAADYLSKNMINSTMLERVIRYAIERSRSKEILEQMVDERTAERQNALEELRVMEEELRTQHEELLQSNLQLVEKSSLHRWTQGDFPLVELITDQSGLIAKANLEASLIFRSSQEKIEGKLVSFFIHLKDRQPFIHMLLQTVKTAKPLTGRFHLTTGSRETDEWCVSVVPLKKDGGSTGQYYWLLHPVFREES